MSTWWKEISVKKAMLLSLRPPPSLEEDNGTLGRGRVGVGGDYALPESLHILNALVRVVEQVFKEPEKC